jgi:transposase InsO family protein
MVDQGWTKDEAAEFLHLSPRTLRHWQHAFKLDALAANALGRPILAATREQRNEVFQCIDELGPAIGLPSLRDLFPEIARAELHDLLRRYRCIWRRLHQQSIHVLHWAKPGSVWAIDFHGPRPGIDGLFSCLFGVRDLASGRQLLRRPVRDITARTAWQELESLFVMHGAPLVLKSDNGSAFIDGNYRDHIRAFGVELLFSPPRNRAIMGRSKRASVL